MAPDKRREAYIRNLRWVLHGLRWVGSRVRDVEAIQSKELVGTGGQGRDNSGFDGIDVAKASIDEKGPQ